MKWLITFNSDADSVNDDDFRTHIQVYSIYVLIITNRKQTLMIYEIQWFLSNIHLRNIPMLILSIVCLTKQVMNTLCTYQHPKSRLWHMLRYRICHLIRINVCQVFITTPNKNCKQACFWSTFFLKIISP